MSKLAPEELSTGFLSFAKSSPLGQRLEDKGWTALAGDAKVLGLFGFLAGAALTELPKVDPAVRDELEEPLGRDLADSLGATDNVSLFERMQQFVKAKGERGPDLLARSIARVIYEVYDLNEHRFVQDDALAACDLLAWGSPGQDARETARRILRISRMGARSTLGHLDGQVELVHKLADEQQPVDYAALDALLEDYAPRIFAQRLPSICKSLLSDRKFRFVIVLWARLRGLVIGRNQLIDLGEQIDPRRPMLLVQSLVEREPVIEVLRHATNTCPLAARIEAAFLARPLA
jgi:hypothetical protein